MKLTLLLNYLLHQNYKLILNDFAANYYPHSIRSVVAADLNLIKAIKDRFPTWEIQGSCLFYRIAAEELPRRGRRRGHAAQSLGGHHSQLGAVEANHLAGFPQKVIVAEGCLHRCPVEKPLYGHRWHTARGFNPDFPGCNFWVIRNPKLFFRATGSPLPASSSSCRTSPASSCPAARPARCSTTPTESASSSSFFIPGGVYNLIDYLAAAYAVALRERIGYIPADYFGDETLRRH